MTPQISARPQSRTSRGRARGQKVHARDFFARTPVFASRATPASPVGIRENRLRSENSHRDVTVDGNGNVRALVKADATTPAASAVVERYAYDGFGRELQGANLAPATSNLNTFKFSTKQLDAETGMNYYGYRFYAADAGRWINRDPIGERGGNNVYAFLDNSTIDQYDYLGNLTITGSGSYSWLTPTPITGLFIKVTLGLEASYFDCCKDGVKKHMVSVAGSLSGEVAAGSSTKGKVRVKNSRGSRCRDKATGRFVKCPKGEGAGGDLTIDLGAPQGCPDEGFDFEASIIGSVTAGVPIVGGFSGEFDYPIYPEVKLPTTEFGRDSDARGIEVTIGAKGTLTATFEVGKSVNLNLP